MVTATFTATRGLDYGLPPDDPATPIDPVESVLVEVHSVPPLTVDSRPLGLEGLLDYLAPKLEQSPEKPVIVLTDLDAPHRVMVDVLDELRQGRARLGLAGDISVSVPTHREVPELWR